MTITSSGLYELKIALVLCREEGETADRWLQRLQIGKTMLEKSQVMLSEGIYVQLATRFFTHLETKTLTTHIVQGPEKSELSMSRARQSIRRLKWDKLTSLVEACVHAGGQKYTPSMRI